MRKGFVFFDFDGCISICNWREQLLPGNKLFKNYDEFHAMLSYDPPNNWIIDMMGKMVQDGYEVIILTGRMENTRKESLSWLHEHGVRYHQMIMRPNEDLRGSEVFKAEVISRFKKEDVKMIFDDRPKIIDHLTSLGYPTFKVKVRL